MKYRLHKLGQYVPGWVEYFGGYFGGYFGISQYYRQYPNWMNRSEGESGCDTGKRCFSGD